MQDGRPVRVGAGVVRAGRFGAREHGLCRRSGKGDVMITRTGEPAERPGRDRAIKLVFLAVLAIAVAGYAGQSQAGPCTAEIVRLQAQFDAMIDAQAGEGRTGRESRGALESHQPTPGSILRAEEGLGEGTALVNASVALALARVADRHGDAQACKEAVVRARRALQP